MNLSFKIKVSSDWYPCPWGIALLYYIVLSIFLFTRLSKLRRNIMIYSYLEFMDKTESESHMHTLLHTYRIPISM